MTVATLPVEAPPAVRQGRPSIRGVAFRTPGRQRHQRAPAAGIVELIEGLPGVDEGLNAREARRWGTRWLLEHLDGHDGDDWQEKWDASGLEEAGPAGFRQVVCQASALEATRGRLTRLTAGLGALVTLDVVRPSFEFVVEARLDHTWEHLLAWRGDPHAHVLDRVPCTAQTLAVATRLLARLAVVTGRPVAELVAQDLLAWRTKILTSRAQTVGLTHVWLCLADAGIVEGTLHEALRVGQQSVTELVDRYPIASRAVRELLIAYLTERSVNIDYSTLRTLTNHLCQLFWQQVERIAPGIDTLELPEDVAARWKDEIRWRTDHNGQTVPRRNVMNTFVAVRGFYADLLRLAHEDPPRWARWASRPPVSEREVKAYRKWRLSLRSEMHERTRTLAVRVTELADAAEAHYHRMRTLLDAARRVGAGETFTGADGTYVRLDSASHPHAHPKVTVLDAGGEQQGESLDLVFEEEDAFWGFAVVEVLRHTGIRIEELLELTQLDLHDYDHRDPAIGKVLLLHISPSKQDRERMLVVAPELAAVLATVTRRIRTAIGSASTALPLLVAYDHVECVNSTPQPFLFQRTAGRGFKGTTRAMTRTYVYRVLNKVAHAAGLAGPDGQLLEFTPHDFRRVFATDALATGLPPHIIQKLMGHATLATTEGYMAIFPDDVIRSHRAFIENRRTLRPADEYRPVADAEWTEFEEHFAKRKIAIGDCMRAYGTNCVHEYACEQCQLARPDPAAEPRLQRTRTGLTEQLDEARQRHWHGETERLTHILAAVNDKLDQLQRARRRTTTIELPLPMLRRSPASSEMLEDDTMLRSEAGERVVEL
jgi:hypothetical protein